MSNCALNKNNSSYEYIFLASDVFPAFVSFSGCVGDSNVPLYRSVYSVCSWGDSGRGGCWCEVLSYTKMGEITRCESK